MLGSFVGVSWCKRSLALVAHEADDNAAGTCSEWKSAERRGPLS